MAAGQSEAASDVTGEDAASGPDAPLVYDSLLLPFKAYRCARSLTQLGKSSAETP